MELTGIKKKRRTEVFDGIRVMEGEVLRAWGEGREKAA